MILDGKLVAEDVAVGHRDRKSQGTSRNRGDHEDESHVHGFTIFHTTHVTLRLLAGQVAGPAKIDHCSLLIINDHNGL